MIDRLGVTIEPLDTVRIIAWGIARLVDTGIKSPVVKINRTRLVIIDSDRQERSVSPSEVAVVRRDGTDGLEGNRPKCTCGAQQHTGCFCDLTPRDFYRSAS